jgi:hypothetical protein
MTHENTSRRMTKGLPSSSNISIDISDVIHPKYILSEPFNIFIEFLHDRSHLSAVHDRMDAVRNDSLKPFKEDDKGTTIEPQILVLIYLMSFSKRCSL